MQPAKASQNGIPCRSSAGMIRNIGRDGNTNQNVPSAWRAMRSASLVSRHSQMIARIETSGSEAISPPMAGLRRATSDTTMTMRPDKKVLMTRYVMRIFHEAGARQLQQHHPECGVDQSARRR